MFQQLVFNSTPVSIYELPTPLVIGSEHYRFHINHQIFGQNRAATQRLYDATQWLRQISSLGNSVADIVHRELMGGHLILLADARPSLAWHNSSEQVFGIWGKLRAIAGHNNGLKISGKIVNDCFIKVAVDPSLSSAAILDFYSHEAAHHLTYVSSGRLSSDPAYHSLQLKNQIIDGLNRDMHAFTGRVKELKMDAALIKVAEDILFERPFSYLTPSRSSLSELRSEIIAYHLQMEMIKPGSTKIFSPEVSEPLILKCCVMSESKNTVHRKIHWICLIWIN
ncbi:hypothetical protein ACKOUO_14475 [Legionella pneumophila]|uniref:hypothetical protein n=1 Tax=Legionella pneumophila TaxID=446 RepID=UPI0038B466BE